MKAVSIFVFFTLNLLINKGFSGAYSDEKPALESAFKRYLCAVNSSSQVAEYFSYKHLSYAINGIYEKKESIEHVVEEVGHMKARSIFGRKINAIKLIGVVELENLPAISFIAKAENGKLFYQEVGYTFQFNDWKIDKVRYDYSKKVDVQSENLIEVASLCNDSQ